MFPTYLSVLVVDDEAATLQWVNSALNLRNHACFCVRYGVLALEPTSLGSFDVLLTNFLLSDMDGWTLIEELALRGDLPPHVIIMSTLPHGLLSGGHLQPLVQAELVKPSGLLELQTVLEV